jgi:hypothetical protein
MRDETKPEVEALAEKVRLVGLTHEEQAALGALLARLAEAEKAVALWENVAAERGTRMDEIQARAEAAEAERDIAREQAANHLARLLDERKAAEARLAEAEKVVSAAQVVVVEWRDSNPFAGYSVEVLASALAEHDMAALDPKQP